MRAAFEAVAAELDAAPAIARPRLAGVMILDLSNRSGFDPSGFGHPRWSYGFEQRADDTSPLSVVRVTVTYEEPIEFGASGRLTVERVAEVFHRGAKTSLSREQSTMPLAQSDLAGDGLARHVAAALGLPAVH